MPDGLMPQRGGGIAGSFNEARWLYAPTGRRVIAQGKAKRRPGIRYARNNPIPERAEPRCVNQCAHVSPFQGFGELGLRRTQGRSRTTQGGASLYPGLSHYAPLGRTIRLRIGVDCTSQVTQVVLGYSGWRLPDDLMPQRGGRIAGSLSEAR